MSIYTEQERDRLIGTPIVEVLAHFGKDYRERGKGMFLSPLRVESDASFHVSYRSNTWYDFGLGIGGGIIDLVCRLSGCERRDALDVLSIINGRYPDLSTEYQRKAAMKDPEISSIEIIRVERKFTNRRLVSYAESRGIPYDILDRHCQEITYGFKGNSSLRVSAIGFMNDLGGYTLRGVKSKRSNSSYITTIYVSGSSNVLVFEGFFDFLSYLAHNETVEPKHSICVLNGVGNLQHALPIISEYTGIYLYLDNDEAGRKTADKISGDLSGVMLNCGNVCQVHDMSYLYRGHKDFNSMLMDRVSCNQQSSNTTEDGNHNFKRSPAETGQDQLGESEG